MIKPGARGRADGLIDIVPLDRTADTDRFLAKKTGPVVARYTRRVPRRAASDIQTSRTGETLQVVVFDLDGTLSDSAPGILAALRHAFAAHGLPPLDPATERALLGPPFYESLPPLIGDARLADVIAAYRERYSAGAMFDTTAYAGVEQVLAAARRAGRRLAVATSKPEHYAVPILARLGLAGHFETIGGDELDGSLRTKALVIAKVLRRLGNPPAESVTMIGDREHDVHGAREHGIDCLGAAWGYGAPGELERAGAREVCATPLDLLAALGLECDAAAS